MAEVGNTLDVDLLQRIASVEEKMRSICDLIPISSWGFTADVHEKLRQRKHRVVNQQLTAKEKKTLTNVEKQKVARTAGGVCHRVSEVIALLAGNRKSDAEVKKSVPPFKSEKPAEKNIAKSETAKKKEQKSIEAVEKKGKKANDPKKEKGQRDSTSAAAAVEAKEVTVVEKKEVVPREGTSSEDDSTDEEVPDVVVKGKKRPVAEEAPVEAKKPKFDVKPVSCESKDQGLDAMEQRQAAIHKLQEKLKSMKEGRQGNKKGDPSVAAKFEQERKLKRRMSKMKLKQRRSEQKKSKVEGVFDEPNRNVKKEHTKEEAVSFSKFDFLVKSDGKKKRLSTAEKKHKFTGKDYKSLITKVEKRKEKLEKLREKEPEKAIELEDEIQWKRVATKAQGVKVKDNIELLQKGLKKKEKMKEKKKEKWANREANVEREKAKKQEKRRDNLRKRTDDKRKKKMKIMKNKGRVL